jgi:hypothetical protein
MSLAQRVGLAINSIYLKGGLCEEDLCRCVSNDRVVEWMNNWIQNLATMIRNVGGGFCCTNLDYINAKSCGFVFVFWVISKIFELILFSQIVYFRASLSYCWESQEISSLCSRSKGRCQKVHLYPPDLFDKVNHNIRLTGRANPESCLVVASNSHMHPPRYFSTSCLRLATHYETLSIPQNATRTQIKVGLS